MKKRSTAVDMAGYAWAIVLCAGICLFILQVQGPPPIAGDGYLERSRLPLLDLSFFFSTRAFTVPLLYKLCGSDPATIVAAQKILLVASWSLLSAVFGSLVRSRVLRLCSLTVFPFMVLWWNLLGWSFILRCEAFSFALFAVWLSALIFFLAQPSRLRMVLLLACAVLFSFTRDNLPYFLILVTALLVACMRCCATALFRKYAGLIKALLLVMLLLGVVQNITAQAGKRQQFCLVNVLLQRIFPNSDYTEWFVQRGMPTDGEILTWRGKWASSHNFALFTDTRYEPFMNWVLYRGTVAYAFFLASHPAYALRPILDQLPLLFPYNLDLYVGKPPDKQPLRLVYAILPAASLPCAMALAIICLVAARAKKNVLYAVPLILLAGLCGNALFVYHADAMEVPRHNLMNYIGLECLAYMALLLLADTVACGGHNSLAESEKQQAVERCS